VLGSKTFLLRIDSAHFFHQHGGIALRPQDVTDRPGDIRRRERRGRHLIEQGLETMMVLPVDHDHVGRSAPERLGRFETAKTRSDDYHPGYDRWHGCSSSASIVSVGSFMSPPPAR